MPQYFGKLPATAQAWVNIGAVEAIETSDRGVHFQCGDSSLIISILDSNLIRVRLAPNGEFMPRRSWAVTRDDAEWSIVPFEVQETADAVEIKTDRMRVLVQRQPCRITCFDIRSRPFAQDADIGMSC